MQNSRKTKSQLIDELETLRRRVAELEGSGRGKQEGAEPGGKQATFHVIDGMADPLMLLDLQGGFLFIDEAHERMSGYKRAEVVGRHFSESLQEALKEEELDKIRQVTEVSFGAKHTPPLEFNFVTRDGREVPLYATASVTRMAPGESLSPQPTTASTTLRFEPSS